VIANPRRDSALEQRGFLRSEMAYKRSKGCEQRGLKRKCYPVSEILNRSQPFLMRAYAITQYGEPDFFTALDIPVPAIKPGHVLIKVAATSVNPVDTKIRAGGRAMCPDLPAVLHMDVAGTVTAVADDVRHFSPGDLVYGCAGGLKTVAGENLGGALAEFMLADARLIAPKPASLSLVEAAALPLVTITAWEGLFLRAGLRAGQTVLIHAGTGGVGHIAVQLAKQAGAKVFTTVSSDFKASLATQLGAGHVINYRDTEVADYVVEHTGGEGFDVVLDTVGGDNLARSFAAARINGTVVSIQTNGEHDLTPLHARGLTLHAVFMLLPMLYGQGREAHGEILQAAARGVDQGLLRPLLDEQQFSFAEAAAAHRRLSSGKALGKVVLVTE